RAAGRNEPLALGDVEGLSKAVRVPGGACAGREVHGADGHARRLLALGDRVDPDVAGEQFGRALGGRLPRLAFHGFSLQLPAGLRRLPSFSEWERWSVCGWVAGVDRAPWVGDFEGPV